MKMKHFVKVTATFLTAALFVSSASACFFHKTTAPAQPSSQSQAQ